MVRVCMVRVCMVIGCVWLGCVWLRRMQTCREGRGGREGVRKKGEEGEHFHHHWSCHEVTSMTSLIKYSYSWWEGDREKEGGWDISVNLSSIESSIFWNFYSLTDV